MVKTEPRKEKTEAAEFYLFGSEGGLGKNAREILRRKKLHMEKTLEDGAVFC
ncbi:hypothetical protein LCGC14_0623740 [marine sediment metagenome]|uniref:Uncharacterized protein n=1 Tax=marine sediment metagenome TaxID=412755 RepID=A0A0F9UCJ3_9ZZZZ